MKYKYLIIIFLLHLSAVQIYSQTRIIAYKSHSGNLKYFKTFIKENVVAKAHSNFGMAPERFVRNSSLDTVILLNAHKVIMITSETCHTEEYGGRDVSDKSLWHAGKDTLTDHPLFNAKNSIQEIKKTLKDEYFFQNPIDHVVFIGFEGNSSSPVLEERLLPQNTLKSNKIYKTTPTKEKNNPSLFFLILFTLFNSMFNTSF